MDANTLSLFSGSPGDTLADRLAQLFADWRTSNPGRGPQPQGKGALRNESAQIYADMWQAFVSFCAPLEAGTGSRRVHVDPQEGLTREQLLDFLEHAAARPQRQVRTRQTRAELTPRYAWRLLQLIDRVLNHGRDEAGLPAIEAAFDLMQEEPFRYANAAALTPVPEILTEAQSEELIAYCTAYQTIDLTTGVTWKVLRDRTAVALMLGAGLAPGQVRVLKLEDITVDGGPVPGVPWRLTVAADGSSAEHQVPIAPWAAQQLAFWLVVRQRLGVSQTVGVLSTPWVFPSTTAGKPWSHPACHRAAVTVLEELGIEGGAPFRLRHTFAVRQLLNGHAEDEVARWMGYADTGPMKRYRHVLAKAPSGVV